MRGKLILQEKNSEYYGMKYPIFLLGSFGVTGMAYMAIMSIKGWYNQGAPFDLGFFLGGLSGLTVVILILLYLCVFPSLRRVRFQIYEFGIVPRYVPLKVCLRKDGYFIPWEKFIRGTYVDYSPKYGVSSKWFLRKVCGHTEADSCFYYLDVKKPFMFGFGIREMVVRIQIWPRTLRGVRGEKIASSEILRRLREEVKIQEKVKLMPYEEFLKIPVLAGE